jgi:hypothetical protein
MVGSNRPGRAMPALVRAAAIEPGSEPAQRNFSQHFFLLARDRMGKPLGLTLRPRGRQGCWPGHPLFAGAKDSCLSYRHQQKDPHPLAQTMGPISLGPTMLAVLGSKDQHARTHTATEKPLTGSTATRSNFHIKRTAVQCLYASLQIDH